MYAGIFIGDYVLNIEGAPQWYEHEPDRVIANEVCKTLWDVTIQRDKIDPDDQILMLMIKPRRWLRWLAWLM